MSIAAEHLTASTETTQDPNKETAISPVHTEVRLSVPEVPVPYQEVIIRSSKKVHTVGWNAPIAEERALALIGTFGSRIRDFLPEQSSSSPEVAYNPNGRFEVHVEAQNTHPFGLQIAELFGLSQQGISPETTHYLSERLNVAMRRR